MLERAQGLTDVQLAAITALGERCVAVDGGRLKLELGALSTRDPDAVNDLLAYERGVLVGFCGRYAFGSMTPEVTGMVDPVARGRGLGGALLDAMVSLCLERGDHRVLVVAPRDSAAARHLAVRRGGRLDHAEHALVLTALRGEGTEDPDVTLRPAEPRDVDAVGELMSAGFGADHGPVVIDGSDERMLVAERDGRVVASLRVTVDADGGRGVYGFVVAPALQGRGIGRDVLRRVCTAALRDGAPSVHLEVEVDNDRALGLYTSIGFARVTTEDYYALDLAAPSGPLATG